MKRAALIGAGPRGRFLAESLVESGAGSLAGVWDRTPAHAEAVAARTGAPAHPSIRGLVEATSPDLVIVATAPAARADVVAAAAAGGATAFLVEKPLALDPGSLRELGRSAEAGFLAVNTQYQWMPHWRHLLGRIRTGDLGRVRSIRASTGVELLDQGPHLLSLCEAILSADGTTGIPTVAATGEGITDYGGARIPRQIEAVLSYPETVVTISAGPESWRVEGETVSHFQQRIDVIGARGSATVTLTRGWRILVGDVVDEGPTGWPADDVSSQRALFLDLAAALEDPARRAVFPTRMESAAGVTRLLFDIVDSARDPRGTRT